MAKGRFVSKSISTNEQVAGVSFAADYLFRACNPISTSSDSSDDATPTRGSEVNCEVPGVTRRHFGKEDTAVCMTPR